MLAKIKLEQSCAGRVFQIAREAAIRSERRIFELRKKGVSSLDWVGLKMENVERPRKRGNRRRVEKDFYMIEKVGLHAEEFLNKSQRKERFERQKDFIKESESGGDFFKIGYGERILCRGIFGAESEFEAKKFAIKVFENELKAAKMVHQFHFE